jgi:hypothetical protein
MGKITPNEQPREMPAFMVGLRRTGKERLIDRIRHTEMPRRQGATGIFEEDGGRVAAK